ncbi:alpha/beta-hydrolase [Hypoxylon trugodes]|uniref:alpha/beta-hydrolase n=1 Tax=Hypoxylon trugodes TaxID=326681 RepID=UPI0021A03E51|nr:alpha/beta-hydrolase [Hypoxylon trugodes]KAI1387260.1 alpha/beta-hydrolase [Hypoxylon trugodes]
MNTATVSMAVTPTVVSTLLSHYLNRKPLRERPTAHLSYDEGLHLIRSFLEFASHHTVEDLQAFTSQWVPHPQWVKVDQVEIPEPKLVEAAGLLQEQLGPDGIKKVGGRNWWQWRKPNSPLKAEWIEMKADYHARKKASDPGKRVMLYVHGGAYFFGSVDEHRYQMQRHARKLKASVFAPEYRLAPQFPFPCGIQDCLAAYLYLLTMQDPTTIILAGDSAGGGMVLSMLVTMRDRGLPLPAGAILISPWVDLTHSFPSVSGDCPLDYIPNYGFHHKPSKAWPPLNADEYALLSEQIAKNAKPGQTKLMKPESVEKKSLPQDLAQLNAEKAVNGDNPVDSHSETAFISINLDGKEIKLKDQIQMYTTNELLSHPLVSPVMQPSLGGLPPLLIMTGSGEILRDEQIYLAHKCANPSKYPPPESAMNDAAREQLEQYKPTDVQLQVWDDLCHVAPTLSFTRPAKFMYRSVAQFGAWALARAQNTEIEILDDDSISVISSSSSSSESDRDHAKKAVKHVSSDENTKAEVGKAGDPLPPFKNHMIRQRVGRHGSISSLAPATDLPGCTIDRNDIGVVKETPVRRWLEVRSQWDKRYGSIRAKIHKRRLKEMAAGYVGFDGETPPPAALASRRKAGESLAEKKKTKSMGLALWSLWGSKHDEETVNREHEADKAPEIRIATTVEGEGAGARSPSDLQKQENAVARRELKHNRSRSRTKIVKDEQQVAEDDDVNENTPVSILLARRQQKAKQIEPLPSPGSALLTPDYMAPETGVTGKRPIVGGIAVPFTLNKEAETASMITLTSAIDQPDRVASPRPLSPETEAVAGTSAAVVAATTENAKDEVVDPNSLKRQELEAAENGEAKGGNSTATTPLATPFATPMITIDGAAGNLERPPLETFVTARDDLPTTK